MLSFHESFFSDTEEKKTLKMLLQEVAGKFFIQTNPVLGKLISIPHCKAAAVA